MALTLKAANRMAVITRVAKKVLRSQSKLDNLVRGDVGGFSTSERVSE